MPTSVPQPADYAKLLADIKARIQAAQTRAVFAVNTEMMRLYWGIGRLLDERQGREGWGSAVIPRLARDLRHELPEVKGFSARNLDRMLAFARAYPEPGEFSPQAVAKTLGAPASPQPVAKSAADSLLWQLPWASGSRPALQPRSDLGMGQTSARVVGNARQAFVKQISGDLSGGLHLVEDPKQAIHSTVPRLGLRTKQLVASDQRVIGSASTAQCEAISKRQAGLLLSKLLGEGHLVWD